MFNMFCTLSCLKLECVLLYKQVNLKEPIHCLYMKTNRNTSAEDWKKNLTRKVSNRPQVF